MKALDPNEITKDSSIAILYGRSRKVPESGFIYIGFGLTFTVAVVYVAMFKSDSDIILDQARQIANLIFSFTTTILGLLIGGFTIFVSVTDPKFFLWLANVRKLKYPALNHLQYIFYVFLNVFISYVFSVFIAIFVLITCSKYSIFPQFIKFLSQDYTQTKEIIIKVSFCVLLTDLIYLLFILGTFLFNVYSVLMISIRWNYENSPISVEIHKEEDH